MKCPGIFKQRIFGQLLLRENPLQTGYRTVFDNVFTDSLFRCRKILFQESPDRKMRKLEQRFPSFRSESRLKPKTQILPCMFSSYSLTRDFRTKSFLVSYLFCNLAPCKE